MKRAYEPYNTRSALTPWLVSACALIGLAGAFLGLCCLLYVNLVLLFAL